MAKKLEKSLVWIRNSIKKYILTLKFLFASNLGSYHWRIVTHILSSLNFAKGSTQGTWSVQKLYKEIDLTFICYQLFDQAQCTSYPTTYTKITHIWAKRTNYVIVYTVPVFISCSYSYLWSTLFPRRLQNYLIFRMSPYWVESIVLFKVSIS